LSHPEESALLLNPQIGNLDSPNARTFSGRLRAPRSTTTIVEVSYGFGYLAHRAKISP
jgi:hypothetical protein